MHRQVFLSILISLIAVSCEGPTGPPGPSGSDSLTDPTIKPKVIYTYPDNNSIGPYENFGTSILLRFNKIMDRTALRRALRLTSPLSDLKVDTTAISTSTGDVFSASVVSADPNIRFRWRIGETYMLHVDTSAEDVN